MKKLHLGCGYNKLKDYINVDRYDFCKPDVVQDLDKEWIWENDSIDHIKIHFVLEHIDYRHFFTEAYRVLKKGGTIDIKVPNGLDFTNFQDPTHIHQYMPNTIQHLSNYKHSHYDSNKYNDWNFKHLKTIHLFRSVLSRCLFYFFRAFSLGGELTNLDNIAYLFVWGIQWKIKKE